MWPPEGSELNCSHGLSLAETSFPARALTLAPSLPQAAPTRPPLTSLLSLQSAAKMIKETMDKKFGSSWHVVIGEGFGFEITHEVKNLLYLYFGGTLAVCVWKCS